MGSSWIIDAVFVLVLICAIVIGVKRGFFRSISGIAGTVIGFIGAKAFNLSVSPLIEKPLVGFFVKIFQSVNAQAVIAKLFDGVSGGMESVTTGVENSGLPSFVTELITGTLNNAGVGINEFAEKYTQSAAAEKLGEWAAHAVAPVITFILLFIVIKIAVSLLCRLLSANIPVIKQLNKTAGGILGTVSGLLIIVLLVWGIYSFAPAENIGPVNRVLLEESIIGGAILKLFFI